MGAFAILVKVCWPSDKKEVHLVDSEKFVIGRASESAIVLPDPKISRKHLGVIVSKGKIYLKDLGSAGGIFAEEKRISAEDVHSYRQGKSIRLGTSNILIEFELFAKKFETTSVSQELSGESKEAVENLLTSAKIHFENSERNAEQLGLKIIDEKKQEAMVQFKKASEELELFRKLKLAETQSLVEAANEEALKIVSDSNETVRSHLEKAQNDAQQILMEARMESEKLTRDAQEMLVEAERKASQAMTSALNTAKSLAKDKVDQMLDDAAKEVSVLRSHFEEEKKIFFENQALLLANEKKRIEREGLAEKEKWAVERQVRDQVFQTEYQKKKNDYDSEIAHLEGQVIKVREELIQQQEQETAKLTKIQFQRTELEAVLEALKNQIQNCESEISERRPKAEELENQLQQMKSEKEGIERQINEMQSRLNEGCHMVMEKQKTLGALQQDIQKKQDDKNEAFEKINQELQMAKEQVHHEAAKYRKEVLTEIDKIRIKEKETLCREAQDYLDQLKAQRVRFIKRLSTDIEGLFLATKNSTDLANGSIQKRVYRSVQKAFDESYVEMSKGTDLDVRVEVNEISKRRKTIFQRTGIAVLSFVLIYFAATSYFGLDILKMTEGDNPRNESAIQAMSREKMEKEAARKFYPKQDAIWKSSYTDNVLYTLDFINAEKSNELEEHWIRRLHQVFVTELKFDDEMVARLVGVERSMLTRLDEERTQIHPDFVSLSVNKMQKIEKESLEKMKEILKTDENLARFMSENQKFWEASIKNRLPASLPERF